MTEFARISEACGCSYILLSAPMPEQPGKLDVTVRVTRCQTHEAAGELLHELRRLVSLLEPCEDRLQVPGLATLNGYREVIAKATKKPGEK